jgi:ABC-type transport system involved in multi-copper enzyme maturation permease subunit
MNSFWNLVGFEYKKILKKKSIILLLFLSLVVTVFCIVGTLIGKHYIDEKTYETGWESMVKERNYARALSGRAVNTDLILKTVDAYSKLPKTDIYYFTKEYEMYVRPYSAIYAVVHSIYNGPSGKFNIEDFQKLTKEQADNFYKIREQNQVSSIEKSQISEPAKKKLLALDAQIQTPFIFEYANGYLRFDDVMYAIGILICFVLAVCIAPIFSGEYISGTDQLILSSKYGKNQLIKAKLFTGMTLSALICLTLMAVVYVLSMLIFGADGRNAPLQLFIPMCPYPLTMGQVALLYAVCILSACLLTAAITMLLSAKLKSPFGVIVIITVFIIAPLFVNIHESNILSYNILNLLPAKMLNFLSLISQIQYELLGMVFQPYVFKPIFTLIAILPFIPFAYRGFKNHQIC